MNHALRVLCVAVGIVTVGGEPGVVQQLDVTNQALAEQMTEGIRQVREGDFESAIVTLDLAARRLAAEPERKTDLATAYLYMGMAYLALGQESLCKSKLLLAIRHSPTLTPSPTEFPTKLRRVFADVKRDAADSDHVARQAKARSGKSGLIALGVGGAVAAGLLSLVHPEQTDRKNSPPTVSMTVSPQGMAIKSVTNVKFTATGADPEGENLKYSWSFGNVGSGYEGTGVGPVIEHVFSSTGTSRVTVTVTDGQGAIAQASTNVVIGDLTGVWDIVGAPSFSGTLVRISQSSYWANVTFGYPDHNIEDTVGYLMHPRRLKALYHPVNYADRSTWYLLYDLNVDDQLKTMEGCAARNSPDCGSPGAVSVKLVRR